MKRHGRDEQKTREGGGRKSGCNTTGRKKFAPRNKGNEGERGTNAKRKGGNIGESVRKKEKEKKGLANPEEGTRFRQQRRGEMKTEQTAGKSGLDACHGGRGSKIPNQRPTNHVQTRPSPESEGGKIREGVSPKRGGGISRDTKNCKVAGSFAPKYWGQHRSPRGGKKRGKRRRKQGRPEKAKAVKRSSPTWKWLRRKKT